MSAGIPSTVSCSCYSYHIMRCSCWQEDKNLINKQRAQMDAAILSLSWIVKGPTWRPDAPSSAEQLRMSITKAQDALDHLGFTLKALTKIEQAYVDAELKSKEVQKKKTFNTRPCTRVINGEGLTCYGKQIWQPSHHTGWICGWCGTASEV